MWLGVKREDLVKGDKKGGDVTDRNDPNFGAQADAALGLKKKAPSGAFFVWRGVRDCNPSAPVAKSAVRGNELAANPPLAE
jgi:hypothetical protein